MNILQIPSWYPTPKFPLWGSYFQEQAKFLNGKEGLDIQILYGEKKSYPLIVWLSIYFKSFLKTVWPISKEIIQQNPSAFGFRFPVNRRVPDFFQIDLEKRLFRKAYLSLIRSGWKPDLIHAQSGMDASIYAHHISDQTGIPFVIIEHQVFVFHYYSKQRSTLIMDAFKAAKRTAAVSYDQRRQVMMNQPACHPEVICNLVDEEKYFIDQSKRNKEFTVVTILNSNPIKGAMEFLEAMKIVIQIDPNVRFLMIGRGADEKSKVQRENLFIRKSKELGIFDNGEFFPFVAREEIPNLLNRAHVFVSPSIQEPFGIAAREAMMCGLPVISTKNGGVEDAIISISGVLTRVGLPSDLANAIIQTKKKIKKYDPQEIRNHCIIECGKGNFLKLMKEFYEI